MPERYETDETDEMDETARHAPVRRTARGLVSRVLAPWRRPLQIWRSGSYISVGLPLGIVGFVIVLVLLAVSTALLVTYLLALPFAWLMFASSRGFAALERSRAAALLDVTIPDTMPALDHPTWMGRLGQRARTRQRWKEIGYNLLTLPSGALGFAATIGAWAGSIALAGLPLYLAVLPNDSAEFGLFTVDNVGVAALIALVGVAGFVVVAPHITLAVARAQVGMAASLLGGGHEAEMAARIERLETSRAAAVDTAESERRRIERDLHDGAQQRLVALAANLGAARDKLDTDPAVSRELVVGAHEEAKAALREIRDLVRGIHPVILEDRGLDAALSAVVARSPVPVVLETDVARRPPAAIESAAYFIVSEALTNVARHSQAARAWVNITRAGDRLVLEVRDDGVGGADADRGSGLQGLRDRVNALGGSMFVISPRGGPTTISVELPCGS